MSREADTHVAPRPERDRLEYPLSYGQQALWLIDRKQPGGAAYIIPWAGLIRGPLCGAALRRAFVALAERHPALRTTFHETDAGPVQRIGAAAAAIGFREEDASAWSEDELERRLEETAYRPFDLAAGPLVRVAVFHRSPSEHVLQLSVHHIVGDFWSLEGLLSELGLVLREAGAAALPPLALGYADYVEGQRQLLAGPEGERLWAYWREVLAGPLPELDFPADRPRPRLPSQRGAGHALAVSAETTAALGALARQRGATLNTVLLAVFQTLLHRYTGQEDVLIGCPTAGRTRAELAGLVGYFVNPVVLRGDLSGDPSFGELVDRLRRVAQGAFAHQDYPFPALVERLAPPRDPSRSPVFQVMFTLQRARLPGAEELALFALGEPGAAVDLNGLRMESVRLPPRRAQFDLTLAMAKPPRGLAGLLSYSPDLFDAATIERMAGHLLTLLAAAAAGPGQRLSELPLLTLPERRQLQEWNATAAAYPRDVCLHELIRAQVERTPDAVAVRFEGQELSYRALAARAGRLARRLRALGVGPEVRVGICAERSLELVVGLLGILEAGGAYVPLDPSYPHERLAYLMEDAEVPVLLTQERLLARLGQDLGWLPSEARRDGAAGPTARPRLLCLDGDEGLSSSYPQVFSPLGPAPDPDGLAYVIYTSGSTGKPKGAMNSHRGIVNRLLWMQERYGLTPGDRVLQKTPFSFDVSVWEFFWPLLVGARLVVARPGGHQDPAYLVETIVGEGITTLHFVPSMLQVFLEAPRVERCTSLKRVIASGEALPPELEQRFFTRLGAAGAGLHNLYGPTEAAVDVTHWDCSPGAGRWVVPIGHPVANTQIHLVGRCGEPVPVGVAGELFIAGVQVGRGYLGRPELTAERFVPDPFSSEPGARMYRTGDLARRRVDGAVEYLGRLDYQVKIRGFRIELGEIEAALAAHPAIAEAVVMARDAGEGGEKEKRLVAYVVPRREPPAAGAEQAVTSLADQLRASLAAALPEYMVPSAFVVLDALPLSPNGKVDRRALAALPLPDPAAAAGAGGELAVPRTPIEEILGAIWAEVLRVEQVGREDDFFRLGGHSLLGTRVVTRVRRALDVELPLRQIFESRTLGALAAQIESLRTRHGAQTAPPIEPVPRDRPLLPSFGQEGLWFVDRLAPTSWAYNVPVAVRLAGRLEVPVLAACLDEIVRRHEALRTTFATRDGHPVQIIAPPAAQPLPLVDLGRLLPARREAEARRLHVEEARRLFDLGRGPLLRRLLLRLEHGPEPIHLAFLTQHHVTTDDWSNAVLIAEIGALYAAFAGGRPSPLPEPPVQYADFASWQRRWLAGEELERQLAFWRRHLAGAPQVLDLPADRPRPPRQSFRGATRAFALPPDVAAGVRDLARREGATVHITLHAAFAALLHRVTGQDDLVVAVPITNRARVELEGLIGLFINTLAMRSDLGAFAAGSNPGFRDLMARARETALAAYAHQDLPFEKLVEELRPERDLSRSPVVQVLFQVVSMPRAAVELPGLAIEQIDTDDLEAVKLDLVLSLRDDGRGAVAGLWRYRRDLFDPSTIARLGEQLRTLVAGAVADPDQPLSELPLLTLPERQQLMEWNATATAYPRDVCLHELIRAQVERTPDAVAVAFEGEELSYRALAARAGRLARRLRALGVGPEVRVGICAERSPELVVGLLGILEAGGAYVPLDPSYPPERLAYMLESAAVPVLLTQERLLARLGRDPGWLSSGPRLDGHVLCLDGEDRDEESLSSYPDDVSVPSPDPDSLAYVIYTSGSTGKPKGAMNSHRGIVNRLLWMQERYGLTAADRVLQKTPFSFDVSVWEFFWPLLVGARLVVARPGGHQDPAYLVETIAGEGITTLHFVPSMLQVFLEAPWVERCTSLKRVIASGEALPPELEQRFFARLGATGAGLHNLYGPTEAAVDVTHWNCTPGAGRWVVPIGHPVANTQIHLVGRYGEPVPVGVAGELFIAGVQVGRGYLGRPELTAERFVPDPFSSEPGARMYRTGDLARRRVDGAVEYLGRLDYQVKIRGFRIELGEIEAAIAAHPGVAEAVVVARDRVQDKSVQVEKRLVAYVVPSREPAPAPPGASLVDQLRASLAATLPEYMVPSAFVVLDALPLSPNGKVDRKALPEPEAPAAGAGREIVAPRAPLERLLAELFQEVLHAGAVGIHDHFFALGGNSIQGATLINRLQERLGEVVHVVAIFDAPTVARLAAFLEQHYPEAVARLTGERAAAGPAEDAASQVDAAALVRLRELVERGPRRVQPVAHREPRAHPAVFVLSPPRSGSTLLRVMLGGHSRLFAPPELELLTFATLAERRAAFPGRDSFWLEGLIRAVMQVRGVDAEAAARLVEECERNGWTTQRFYRQLQEWVGGRVLVDKTPSYAFHPSFLARAEEQFEGALYVHLTRHPCGTLHSFAEGRLDQIFFPGHAFARRELAELCWLASHRNILDFLAGVPAARQLRVRFEDLVRDPRRTMTELAAFLGIAYEPGMVEPYAAGSGRMTDGLHRESRMLGDVKFHQHRHIDPAVAERWRGRFDEDSLGALTRDLAALFGYGRAPAAALAIEPLPWPPGTPAPLAFPQERLWFLDRMQPGLATYNIPSALRISGPLAVAPLRAAIAEIVRRHAALRTTFGERDGRPFQTAAAAEAPPPPLHVVDLSRLPHGAAREREALRLAAAEAQRPFDLAAGPLLRTTLLWLARGEQAAHVFLFTMHHIVSDGWSVAVFLRELAALYRAFAAAAPGPVAALPELPIQYVDFVRWQRRRLAGEALERDLAHWQERLAGAPVALELPTDRPRPPVQGHRGGHVVLRLPQPLTAGLTGVGREEGATLFMSVLAGVGALLHRLSGQADLLLGSVFANRTRAETEGLIGFFVNTLVFRTDFAGDPGLRSLLAAVRQTVVDAFAHQEVPFERLVEALAPVRDPSRSPLVQVMVVLQNAPPALDLPGLRLDPFEAESGVAKFDLAFVFTPAGDGLELSLEYDRDLWDATTARRMAAHLERLLAAAVADPERRLSDLPLLTAAERRQLREWNDTALPVARARLFHRQVADWAVRTPEATAVVFGEQRLSYAEVVARAGRLARRLRRLGVGPEALVGIAVERSPEMVVGILAVLEAGGAYLPLDPSYPRERLELMVADARPRVLLTQERLLPQMREVLAGAASESSPLHLICLDRKEEIPAGTGTDSHAVILSEAKDLGGGVAPDNLAYVIYTSGSTGRPKGVGVTHAGLVNLCAAQAACFGLDPGERVLQFSSASFDASVFEVVLALSAGAELHLADRDALLPGPPLLALLRERGITNATLTPTTLGALAPAAAAELPALRTLQVAGEACPPELARAWSGGPAGRRFFNAYGPTESTIWATLELFAEGRRLTIGRPIPNFRLHVLDRTFATMPAGVPGELCIGGAGVARGYLGRPELTADRFVPDPFAERPGARLYRTGDLARWLPDGRIDFLGRIDHQVKLRGFRIELGEIETALAAHPAVAEVVVLAVEGGDGEKEKDKSVQVGKRLVAYVVPRRELAAAHTGDARAVTAAEPPPSSLPEASALAPELRSWLAASLPDYMVPSAFVFLDAFPLSPSGKVDRRALPAPQWGAAGAERHVAPRTLVEELLAEIWCRLLGVERVGVDDGFFALGGHSLLATQLAARVRDACGVELPVRRLFESPTLAALAREVEAALAAGARPELPPLAPAERGAEAPLSFAQERLWFLEQLEPGAATYNIPAAVRLQGAQPCAPGSDQGAYAPGSDPGRLDVAAFGAALTAVVERHEALRTTFAVRDGEPVQVIAAAARVAVPVVDLAALPESGAAGREAEARRLAAAEAARPFDLAAGPLLRCALLRLAAGERSEHLALLGMHHIVSDGWSMGLLLRELGTLYAAFVAGKPAAAAGLPPLPVQYADFAIWQRGWLTGEVLAAQLAYWREALAGAPAVLELPADRPRPAAQSYRGGSVAVTLPPALAQRLAALAREQGATLFMVLLAGFQALLARHSGQRDLVVGTPVGNRTHAELEGLIGFFVNTLALRADLTAEPSFLDLLARVRERALAAYTHQDLPFEKLVEELQPERSLAHSPLFQVLFVLQNAPGGGLDLPGLTLTPLPLDSGTAKFDLTLSLGETPDGLDGALQYSRDLFDRTTAMRLLGHLETLLAAAGADPAAPVLELPLLTAAERRQLGDWNATGVAYPAGGRLLHELIAEQAARTPRAVAASFEGETLTYAALARRAARLARHLRRLGAGPEVRVGVCAERSLELVVALLGVLEAGAAYVPLDPSYPAERLAYMLESSAVPVLLTQRRLVAALPRHAARVVCLDEPLPRLRRPLPPAPEPPRPDSLAYVIYTSGSTGKPKGAMNSHRGIVNRLLWMQATYGLTAADRVLQKTPFSFDVSVWEFFWPLLAGARLVMARPGGHQDPAYLVETIVREGITTLHFVPSMLQAFAEAPGVERCTSIRRVIASGEALPLDLVERLYSRFAPGAAIELHNLYGPTEAAVDVTYWACERGGERRSVPIGRPVANTRIHLLDEWLLPVPAGVAGELWIGGVQVGRGYLGRPELTAERFTPDPFGTEPGARLYRTGDLARWQPDGAIEYLGRLDHQVKLRGFRIELGEIEIALAAHAGVAEAVVLALEEKDKGLQVEKRLVAFVVPRREAAAAGLREALRASLAAALPEYMVPSAFVVLDALPLSPNGKVDRKALAGMAGDLWAAAPGAAYVAPRTPLEELVAGVWSDLLRVERVGVEDNFFALGGHSLLAARVVGRLQQATGVELPLRRLFEAPTVAALAAELAARQSAAAAGGAAAAGPPPLRRLPRPASGALELPLSFAQERLWFLDQLEPESPWYNVPAALRSRGRLDVPALAAALGEIVRRHEALRTVFAAVDGRPVQVIQPAAGAAAWSLPVVDLRALGAAGEAGEEAANGLIEDEMLRPFTLAAGPLLRTTLLRLAEEAPELPSASAPANDLADRAATDAEPQHVLLLTTHHIVSDGWSTGVFLRELAALYDAFAGRRPSPLAPLPIQYGDFAVWQRAWLEGDALDRQLAWWRERLAGAPEALELPTDHPRPPVRSSRGGEVAAELSPEVAAALVALARRSGATLFMTLLAAWGALLQRYSGQDDVVVGSPVAGRGRPETDGLIGFFVNTLALRLDLQGAKAFAPGSDQPRDPSFVDLLARVRETALGAYAHQDLPFERLVEALQPLRDPSRTPLFQVVLVLQNAPAEPLALPGLALEPVPLASRTAKFDLTLSLAERDGTLAADLGFSRDLFDAATAERLLRHFRTLLAAAVAEPGRALVELPLLEPAERRQLLRLSAGPVRDFPRQRCLHELVEEQARRRPHAAALVWDDGRLTYAQLDARANRLARRLRRLGVTTDTRVAVSLERSPELIVTLLAVLKAGGAYLPLDPAYPAERLIGMLEDGEVPVLVTTAPLRGSLPEHGGRTLLLDREAEAIAEESAAPLANRACPESLAYVLFTSGSTGRPKGVALRHQGVVNLVTDSAIDFGEEAVFLQLSPMPFDASTLDIWQPLANGGRVAIPPPAQQSLEDVGEALVRHGVTAVFLTAGLFHQMVEAQLPALAGVRRLMSGGDVLSVAHVRRVLDSLAVRPDATLTNIYGPTEATTYVTCNVMDGGARLGATVSIGAPIGNTRILLLDRLLQPVPVGVPGELFIGGAGVARGYVGRPDLTAERFVPDPLPAADGGTPGGRLYRTGDLARWLAGGTIEFLGRLDQQVKIRGFRIEPAEIETVLCAHPAVREAVVLPRADRAGGKVLVAYLVATEAAAPAGAPLAAALRDFLRRRLPAYMVPAFFVALPELPLDPNGKVDRRALAAIEPFPDAATAAPERAAARTPVEEVLAALWAEVLGRERVGVDEDFFALGGHSLLAARLVSRLREALGVKVPLPLLFERPTVADLAAALATAPADASGPPPLTPAPRSPAGDELSFAQQRLWFLDRLEPGSAMYNVPLALRAVGRLDVAAWAAALAAVVRRHETLRTTFPALDGRPVQRVEPWRPRPLPLIELGALPPARRHVEAERLAEEEARRPFDLAAGPLFRTLLVRLAPEAPLRALERPLGDRVAGEASQQHLALITQHHIVSDGWSLAILLGELATLYRSFAADGAARSAAAERSAATVRSAPAARAAAAALPPLPVQYADYARWQRRWLRGEALASRLAYWRERLAGVAVLELPTDRPRPPVQTFRGRARGRTLPPAWQRAVFALGRREGATLYMTLLAGFQALLQRSSGQDDFAVGSPVANRGRREIEGLIGFFVNTVVLRADLGGDPTFRELLARVRSTALGAFAHEEVPFERLVEELAPERDLGRSPLFQVAFALQQAPALPELPGLRLEAIEPAKRDAKFDLGMAALEVGDGLAVGLAYNTDLFDGVRIERMLGHFATLLAAAAEDPERRLSELPLLSAAERQQLQVEWNTQAACPVLSAAGDEDSPVALFEAQVARVPDNVALVYEGERMTYRELAALSEHVAQHLRALGVGPETRVGVCLERSFAMVAALLGVLKAGAAYVPLDPSYPRERLAFMLADSGAAALLTENTTRDALPPHAAPEILLDAFRHNDSPPACAPRRHLRASAGQDTHPDNAAYVIYTSGSTGAAKGVVVSRRAMANLLRDRRGAVDERDRVLHKTPISFDASTFEIFSPLVVGGRSVLARPGGQQDAAYLVRLIAEEGITVAGSPPSMLAALLEQDGLAACRSLRRMATGSEAVPHELAERFLALGLCDLWNLYGPTETTVAVLEWRCRGPEPGGVLPIGRPIAGARVYLLDRDGNPVPSGVPGELYVGGPSLARGYLNRPDLTAERYLPDPFGGEPGARLYRTGDLARRRGDGAVEFLGRADRQVKLRGFRVELGEVEAALAAHPEVAEAVVLLVGQGENGKSLQVERRLVAFIVPRREPAATAAEDLPAAGHPARQLHRTAPHPDPSLPLGMTEGDPSLPGASLPAALLSLPGASFRQQLRSWLAATLPEHMVPSTFVVLAELPLAPSGKVDRAALARLEPAAFGAPETAAAYLPPRDGLELRLAQAWEEVLGIDRVGVRDGFFELGGHSLLAVRLMSRVARLAGRELPLATLFQAPTVEQMARLLRQGEAGAGPAAAAWSPLVALREPVDWAPPVTRRPLGPNGRRPFFCVHPIGGSVFCYRDLAERLGRDQPFYGLEARGLAGGPPPHGDVRAMAADYLAAIRAVQPLGPYLLGGWSFGGLVAVEMARQLEERGERVALLALIDAAPAEATDGTETGGLTGLQLLARDLGALAGWRHELDGDDLARRAPDDRLAYVVERLTAAGALPPDLPLEQIRRLVRLYAANARAIAAYVPPVCGSRITLLVGSDSPARRRIEAWRAIAAGGLDVVATPGDHYTLLQEPRVAALAAALRSCLDRAHDGAEADMAAEVVPELAGVGSEQEA